MPLNPAVWVTPERIYTDLGDGIINFKSLDHMIEVLEVYRKVLKRGSVGGSATFTPETIIECRRRFNNLIEAIKIVKRIEADATD